MEASSPRWPTFSPAASATAPTRCPRPVSTQPSGRFLVNASGPLSTPVVPPFPGREEYAGVAFHTNDWDHSVDLRGKRVAVVGSGASAAQVIPAIQADVGHTSAIFVIEAQLRYIVRAITETRDAGACSIEVTAQAEADYTEMIHREMEGTVWKEGGCTSWYQSRSGRVVAMFPGFSFTFRRLAGAFRKADHRLAREAPVSPHGVHQHGHVHTGGDRGGQPHQ